MQFSCSSCSTRYSVPDEKLRGKRVRTKCRKCGAEIVVEGPPAAAPGDGDAAPTSMGPASIPAGPSHPTARPAAAGTVAGDEGLWTVAPDRASRRKMTTQAIVEAYAAGSLDESALIWKQGMSTWQHPSAVPAVALALQAGKVAVRPRHSRAAGPGSPEAGAKSAAGASVFGAGRTPTEAPPSLPPPAMRPPEPARLPIEAGKPPARAEPSPPPSPGPEAPSPSRSDAPGAFDFDDESTAVIAPDRARELLEAEVRRSAALESEAPPLDETPMGFGFDDEATRVIDRDEAHSLLDGPGEQPPPAPARAANEAPAAFPAARDNEGEARAKLPSVMVKAPPTPVPPPRASVPPTSKMPGPSSDLQSLIALSNEPTRVIRPKKLGGLGFWMIVFLALVAAAAAGFIASELVPRADRKSQSSDGP